MFCIFTFFFVSLVYPRGWRASEEKLRGQIRRQGAFTNHLLFIPFNIMSLRQSRTYFMSYLVQTGTLFYPHSQAIYVPFNLTPYVPLPPPQAGAKAAKASKDWDDEAEPLPGSADADARSIADAKESIRAGGAPAKVGPHLF